MHDISNIDLFSYITGIRPSAAPSGRPQPRPRSVAPRAWRHRLAGLLAIGLRRRPATAAS